MKLILFDNKPALREAWRKTFDGLPDVEVSDLDFHHLEGYNCLVSPANSFGIMDGGFDAIIIDYFGKGLMQRVHERIIDDFRGEQPVGTSFIVETMHYLHPYLAHTPTMRVPMVIAHTDNVYKAMFAMLLAVDHHNRTAERKIESVACPGLGTGYGGVPTGEAAYQMALAYRNFLNPPTQITGTYALRRQAEIRYGGDGGYDIKPRK